MEKVVGEYKNNVFLNCPFDNDYNEIFNAIVFAVHSCGFVLRCAKEENGNAAAIRILKIEKFIKESKYAIHDISRVTLDLVNNLPRFNMPLELGLWMGAAKFGQKEQKGKKFILLDSIQYRYQQFISDLSGQDPKYHENSADKAIEEVRKFLSDLTTEPVPTHDVIINEYKRFQDDYSELCRLNRWTPGNLTYSEHVSLVNSWLRSQLAGIA